MRNSAAQNFSNVFTFRKKDNNQFTCELWARELPASFNLHYKLSGQTEMRAFVQNLTVHNRKSFNIPRMASNSQSHVHSWQNKTRTTDKKLIEEKKDHSKCNTVSSTKMKRREDKQETLKGKNKGNTIEMKQLCSETNKERINQCQDTPRCVPPMCALARV